MNTTKESDMTQTTVKPADLEAGDRILSINGYRQSRSFGTVVRVDHVDDGYVRFIRHGKGSDGVGDYQEAAHPTHDIVVAR